MAFRDLGARIFHGYAFTEVTWQLEANVALGDSAEIEVARSENEKGPFQFRGRIPATAYRFEDRSGDARGGRHTWYYRLILHRAGKPAVISRVFSDARFKTDKHEAVFTAVLARQLNQLRHRSGTACLLYRQITAGPVCPACVDASSGQSAGTSRCEVCYGTGIHGGYAAPLATFVQKAQASRFEEKKQDGLPTRLNQDNIFITPALPRIYPGDLFVFPEEDMRYEVDPTISMPSMLGQHPLEHQFPVEKIPTDSVIYKIPIPENW